MALWFPIMVNHRSIGYVSIQRLAAEPPADLDEIYRYWWEVHFEDGDSTRTGHLTHRYRDGPLTLLRKVLDAAEEEFARV